MLTKVEASYGEIEKRATLRAESDNSSKQLYFKRKQESEELREIVSGLRQKQEKLQEELNLLLYNEQLFRLQCDFGKFDPRILLR